MKKKKFIKMSIAEFKKEHKHLIKVLRGVNRDKHLAEAKKQEKELRSES